MEADQETECQGKGNGFTSLRNGNGIISLSTRQSMHIDLSWDFLSQLTRFSKTRLKAESVSKREFLWTVLSFKNPIHISSLTGGNYHASLWESKRWADEFLLCQSSGCTHTTATSAPTFSAHPLRRCHHFHLSLSSTSWAISLGSNLLPMPKQDKLSMHDTITMLQKVIFIDKPWIEKNLFSDFEYPN